jgi:hypothetical protein
MKKTDNQILAEYMGLTPNPFDYGKTYGINATVDKDGTVYAEEWVQPNYDKSWDSLMKVVDKIEESYKNTIRDNIKIHSDWIYCSIGHFRCTVFIGEIMKGDNRELLFPDKLSATFFVVTEYVKWFNNQNK